MERLRRRPVAATLRPRRRVDDLRGALVPIVQTAAAAGAAWLVAHDVVGHDRPFFAPIAATIALGLAPGVRSRRAAEMVLGVALGIAVGDLLIAAIGTGAAQVAVVVVLAMSVAVLAGGGPLLVSQAASSGVLVATLAPSSGLGLSRFGDALIGGAVGLAVLVAFPRDPLRAVRRDVDAVLQRVGAICERLGDALETGDAVAAAGALDEARATETPLARLRHDVVLGTETVRLAPMWWRARGRMGDYAAAAVHVDRAVRNVRVLARAVRRVLDVDRAAAPATTAAVRSLAAAARAVAAALADPDAHPEAVAALERAAVDAAASLDAAGGLAASGVVGQIRFAVVDLLLAVGVERDEAVRLVRGRAEGAGTR